MVKDREAHFKVERMSLYTLKRYPGAFSMTFFRLENAPITT